MGANAVNTMAEALAPELSRLTGGRSLLRILSNLAVYRLARAWTVFSKDALAVDGTPGEEVVEAILDAWCFAANDPFRCATHNKGIMNGICAVATATGNDTRALEAGAHSYAAWKAREHGIIAPLTVYEKDHEGNLVGSIELPMAVGTVGGSTAVHPTAKLAVKILGVSGAQELGTVMAAVGLAQNFAALRALSTEGIQRGHMSLHARNVAISAGATPEEADRVAKILVSEKLVRQDRAAEVLKRLRSK
jgi:hydroxymethylglutaryl-CoA reductase